MSIYKKEASWEEMTQEAVRRMELLGLGADMIWQFRESGAICLSQHVGKQIHIQPSDDEIHKLVERFEKEFECLVYHVLWANTPMVGTCWSLLFVSPTSSDWKNERSCIKDSGLVYAYVESELEDGIGEILVTPRDNGLVRIG
jgi:hypothetical protein